MAAAAASSPASAAAPALLYQAKGKVIEIEDDVITLQHEPVPALKWPGMTMPFNMRSADVAKGLKPGQAIEFTFSKGEAGFVITHIKPLGAAPAASGAKR
jgi:Cu(I)/Ag(I) efflux system membrane fusion protein